MQMKKNIIERLNALTLLIVFSLNTMVGFACSVGPDMGFNRSHHQGIESKKHSHHHEGELNADHHHAHGDSKGLNHAELGADQHSTKTHKQIPTKDKDKCCKDEVIKFAKVDKQTSRSIVVIVPFFVFAAVIPTYHSFDVIASGIHKPDKWHFVRCHHPPISDIRIAIQSFQI